MKSDVKTLTYCKTMIYRYSCNNAKFDYKSALIGILTAHQLFYFLERRQNARGANPEVLDRRESDCETLHEE